MVTLAGVVEWYTQDLKSCGLAACGFESTTSTINQVVRQIPSWDGSSKKHFH